MQVIIVGAGSVGFNIAERLASENKKVVLIDKDYERLEHITEVLDVQTIHGSGSNPAVLEKVGITDEDILVAATDSDEINFVTCFFANMLSPKMTKLARIKNIEYNKYKDFLEKNLFNITMIINPEQEIVHTIERLIHFPGIEDIGEFAHGKIRIVGVRVAPECILDGVALSQIHEKVADLRFLVGAIIRNKRLIIPSGKETIEQNDLVYFVCKTEDLGNVLKNFGQYEQSVKNVMIIGGGDIGFRVASVLEKGSLNLKIIEKDPGRCHFLSEWLNNSVVLNGDGSDMPFLEKENIAKMDVVLTLTGDEETNVLCSLLAKQLGTKSTTTRITKLGYMSLVESIGLTSIVSPRISAIDAILKFIRRGKVISTFSFKGEKAEVLEAIAQEKSYIIGNPLKDLPLLRGTVVLAVTRGDEIIIPDGETIIKPDDRIMILSSPDTVAKVENTLIQKGES